MSSTENIQGSFTLFLALVFARARRFFSLRFGGFLFIVGDVKSRALEDQSGTAGNQPLNCAPCLTLRAVFDRLFSYALKKIESVAALFTPIFIGGHSRTKRLSPQKRQRLNPGAPVKGAPVVLGN
jgi:hypothetical protein